MTYKFLDEKGAHVHTLDSQPLYGTSTVVKEVMPPFLAKWGAQCAVDYIKLKGYYAPTTDGTEPSYKIQVKDIEDAVNSWTKVRKDAATKGTDMHADLEDYVKLCIERHDGTPQWDEAYADGAVGKFAKWATDNVETFIFAEKNTYSRALWVGGVIDCLARLRGGKLAIIDFKSSKEAYFNSFVQVAGYAVQLEESGWGEADGSKWHPEIWYRTLPDGEWADEPIKIGALIVVPFGAKVFKPVMVENVEGFKDSFKHIVEVYKLQLAFKNR